MEQRGKPKGLLKGLDIKADERRQVRNVRERERETAGMVEGRVF